MIILNQLFLVILFLISALCISQKPKLLKWQPKPVIGVAYSSDGNYLATLCSDKTISLWNTINYNLIKVLNDNKEGETCIDFSSDSKYIVSGNWDKTVKIWDIQKGQVIRRLIGHSLAIKTVAYMPNGSIVASAGWDNQIKIWYAPTGIILKNLTGHNQCVRCIAFSPDGKTLASGSDDTTVKLWDISTSKVVGEFKDHIYPIETLEFSPDGKYLASGSYGSNVIIWDIGTNKIHRVLKGHTDGIYSISYGPNGKYLAAGSSDKTILIWDIEKNQCVKTFKGFDHIVKGVDFNPNGKELASVSSDKSIRIWDISDLNIKPANNDTIKQNAINEHKNIFQWTHPKDSVLEVYDRNMTLNATLSNNITLNRIKLFINKKEYVEYNGYKTFVKNPMISPSLDKTHTNIEYHVYLYEGENEIQLYAENEDRNAFTFSNALKINYYNLDQQVKNTNLHVVFINIPGYNHKKLEKNYIPNSCEKIKNILIGQENILYKSVIMHCLDKKEQLTKENIENFISDIAMKINDKDHVLIFISGIFIKNNKGEIAILTPDYMMKDLNQHSVKLSFIGKKLSYIKNYTGIFADISNQTPKETKEISKVDLKETEENLRRNIVGKDNFSIEIIEGTTGNVFDIVAHGFHNDNDKDENITVDTDELHTFINQLCKTEYYRKGRKVPLYFHKSMISNH